MNNSEPQVASDQAAGDAKKRKRNKTLNGEVLSKENSPAARPDAEGTRPPRGRHGCPAVAKAGSRMGDKLKIGKRLQRQLARVRRGLEGRGKVYVQCRIMTLHEFAVGKSSGKNQRACTNMG